MKRNRKEGEVEETGEKNGSLVGEIPGWKWEKVN